MTDAPKYPRGGDPRRRARLYLELHGRRRVARVLDRHLGIADEPLVEDVDWHAVGADLTVRGRELLAELQVAA